MNQSDDDVMELFEQVGQQSKEQKNEQSSQGNRKRLKKHKKEKKDKKKKRKRSYDQQQQLQELRDYDEDQQLSESNGLRQYLEEEASQDSQQQQDISDQQDQIPRANLNRKQEQDRYRVHEKKATQHYMDRLQGKNDRQINDIFQRKAQNRQRIQEHLPSMGDPILFVVGCKIGKEQQLAMTVLNKASYYNQTKQKKYEVNITGILALKKKYPGKLFVQAFDQKSVRDSLQSFIEINVKKITRLQNEQYNSLFEKKQTKEIQYKQGQYVRVKKGVYKDDLAKIVKAKKNRVEVILVPRIDVQQIIFKFKQLATKNLEQEELKQKRIQIFQKYTNPRTYYPDNLRPPKKILHPDALKSIQELINQKDKLKIASQDLLQINLRYNQISRPEGTIPAIQLQPFVGNNAVQSFRNDSQKLNVKTTIKLQPGDKIDVSLGELAGCFGIVLQIKDNTIVIKCTNKQMSGKIIEQHIDHLTKRFKQNDYVKVISGIEKGKTGTITQIQGPNAYIWTDNQHTIKINKNNLQYFRGKANSVQNSLQLKKDDLIKTTKGSVGVILSTNKDNIKILDLNNFISIVSNLEYDSKLNFKASAKNKHGDTIQNQTIVRIKNGPNQGKRCDVKHIYRDHLFLFNPSFNTTGGYTVQKVDNCTVFAQNIHQQKSRNNNKSSNKGYAEEQELKVGGSITIQQGSFKGYRGIIKSINKDRIQVRIPQKNQTEWINKESIKTSEQNLQTGKTPRRGLSMTANYAQSPMI